MSLADGERKLTPQSSSEGTAGAEPQMACAASDYDVAPRPTGREVTRIQHAIQGIRTAYFGAGSIYGSRISAAQALKDGLEEVPEDSSLLLDLVVGAIGAASGGLGGFLTGKLLTAMGAVLSRAAHPHNAIGPAPASPSTTARIVNELAGLAVAEVAGKAKELATQAARSGLRNGGDKPSVLAFVNAQVDALEELSREKNRTWDSAALELELSGMPQGHLVAERMRDEISRSAEQAKLEQTVATVNAWSRAYREDAKGRASIAVEVDPASGSFSLVSTSIEGTKPDVLKTLRDRGATLKDLVMSKSPIEVVVDVGGEASLTLPAGSRGIPTLAPGSHLTQTFFRELGRVRYGMGPNADPQVAASIAVQRHLMGARL